LKASTTATPGGMARVNDAEAIRERKRGEHNGKEKGTIEYLCANYFQNSDVILPITSHSLEHTVSGSAARVALRVVSPTKMDIIINQSVRCDPSVIHRRSTLINLVLGRGVGLPSVSQVMARGLPKLPSRTSRSRPLDSASQATPCPCPS
jgi:hypothetical protein